MDQKNSILVALAIGLMLCGCEGVEPTASYEPPKLRKTPIDLSEPIAGDPAIDRRVLHALALSSADHKVSAVGRSAKTLQLFDGNCTREILDTIHESTGEALAESGFARMVCFDGAEVFAKRTIGR